MALKKIQKLWRNGWLLLLGGGLSMGCTARMDIDTRDSEPVIVIYGCLTDEEGDQRVRITRSSPFFDDRENAPVEDAVVRIASSGGEVYEMHYEAEGFYVGATSFAARPGVTYSLRVEVDFDSDGTVDSYEAQTTIPSVVPVDSVNITRQDIMGYRHFSLNVYLQEPAETEDYYLFKFRINDGISNDRLSEFLISEDRIYNGSYLDGVNVVYIEDATDERVIEKNKDNDDKVYVAVPGDPLSLHVLHIEKGYYRFIRECLTEQSGENPLFGGPPSNISTNLSDGAVGYFTGYCIQECTAIVP
jgi:hypothetical protein